LFVHADALYYFFACLKKIIIANTQPQRAEIESHEQRFFCPVLALSQ